ncbi:MAG: tRNA (N(6)-L-threonylcarbamoyladenosine(37)-C(2))-methylthiotransferase MtaB [Clostridia bacterium]|nr:tRNA (N(6)-L-threonylcarbamoyladenosine(37)-C(2))-methylthiotransferase MtaB [Clostridia bacterium]
MSRKTFSVSTLGCRINFYESAAIAEQFLAAGYEKVAFTSQADVTLIHSCAVTAEAEKKGRALISRALKRKRETGGVVCVFGCMAEKRREELYKRYPELDLVWGNADMSRVFELCDARVRGNEEIPEIPRLPKTYNTPAISSWYSPRAFVKIQDGCNSFCTYCIVTYLRGRELNREMADILSEVRTLTQNGAREIVLSGIETAAFGADALLELSNRIAELEDVRRIRFGSLKPTLFTRDFCEGLSRNSKIMPQFHLSVQSGSANVLFAMRRDYTREQLLSCVENLRVAIPHVALTADLICGFPGETEADFQDTVSFLETARLLHAHIFPYSEREGTRAASFENQVPVELRRSRALALGEVALRVHQAEFERILPMEREILVERFRGGNALGHSEHFLELSLPRATGDAVGGMKTITKE